MDRFEDLRTFVRVVEAGSLTGAAERLQREKSAVSRRVSELEDRLGVRLLNCTTRRLNLTETGRDFHVRCVRLLSDLEEAELAVSSEQGALIPILTEYALPEESAYAVYPPGRHLSHRVRVFIDFLAERFGEQPYWDRFLFPDPC